MRWFSNLKISMKLISSFVLVALIAGVVGIIGIMNLKKIDTNYTDLYINYGVASNDIGKISTLYQRSRVNIRGLLLEEPGADLSKYTNTINDINQQMPELLSNFEKSLQSDKDKRTFAALKSNMADYRPLEAKIINLASASQVKEAFTLLKSTSELTTSINDQIQELFDSKVVDGDRESVNNTKTTNNTVATMMIIIAVAMLVAIALGLTISRMISNPVKRLVGAANKLAEGDLDIEIESRTTDEVGILSSAFKKMTDNLNDVMANIASAAEQVTAGSKQVSESSVALSQGATEQASSVEQLTASLEEISAQTTQNAGNANQANEIAETAKKNAIQGNEQMKEMLEAMDEINESSNSISKIIKVIDEIAFQTNILALNAAVEAARAGQHGKGFAVVAEEVRNLAARSANAAKETTAMIEGSIKKVEGGTKIANETAAALNRIVDGVAQVATFVHEIANASNEQAVGISQINQGIIQVSSVVQTNSATSEESAAASEELSSQAVLLNEQVTRFKLRRQYRAQGPKSYEEFSPDMLRMLENMSNNKGSRLLLDQGYEEKTAPKYRINLSDQEFGKY
ncbi:HAMP domain-containing protein [Cohnella endophytica]|uniref:HAMP domain-containing protein n=1 Tax=Cohnella endophytica TaxID=2419778 RepID=A0A494XGV0_9BACL|nr:methyl-accepting chemotaxis protein [Cohnella endophytica]RKP49890.1 HAMP domain-containing protein [Cohnella endophytica]